MAFQSPATNYAEKRIDFTNLVSLSPTSTYVWECTSDYPEHGILKGSLLAVDRSLKPKHDNLVIANVDNELVICKLLLTPVPSVQVLSNQSSIIPLNESAELPIWGVIAYVLTDLAGQGFSQVTSVSQDLSNE
ncbi:MULTISPECIES: S24 family peptidase [Enterobacterales]|uniref:Peptidase n=1 Tax=Chimaeribacter coloradensis TaxID=2060068 RepID=A0A2N5DST4_9GAMM|nr:MULTISPECIES: S24 family peptidase [Enterobacterales]PLR29276.1 peptidase [Chimaeribacter coloradensis]